MRSYALSSTSSLGMFGKNIDSNPPIPVTFHGKDSYYKLSPNENPRLRELLETIGRGYEESIPNIQTIFLRILAVTHQLTPTEKRYGNLVNNSTVENIFNIVKISAIDLNDVTKLTIKKSIDRFSTPFHQKIELDIEITERAVLSAKIYGVEFVNEESTLFDEIEILAGRKRKIETTKD